MVNSIFVMLCDATGKAVAIKGPFGEAQNDAIFGAIEDFELDYNLNSIGDMSLCPGGKVRVSKVVYEKGPTL